MQDHAAGIGVGGGDLVLAGGGKLLFDALILSALSFCFFSFHQRLPLSFIQVTGIEFFDIGLNLGIDVFQLPVDFFWLKLFFLELTVLNLLESSATSVFPVRPLRLSCRTKWVNALRKSCGFSDRKPAIVRKQGCRPFNSHSSSCSAGTHAPGAGRFGSCSGIRRHTI